MGFIMVRHEEDNVFFFFFSRVKGICVCMDVVVCVTHG